MLNVPELLRLPSISRVMLDEVAAAVSVPELSSVPPMILSPESHVPARVSVPALVKPADAVTSVSPGQPLTPLISRLCPAARFPLRFTVPRASKALAAVPVKARVGADERKPWLSRITAGLAGLGDEGLIVPAPCVKVAFGPT